MEARKTVEVEAHGLLQVTPFFHTIFNNQPKCLNCDTRLFPQQVLYRMYSALIVSAALMNKTVSNLWSVHFHDEFFEQLVGNVVLVFVVDDFFGF